MEFEDPNAGSPSIEDVKVRESVSVKKSLDSKLSSPRKGKTEYIKTEVDSSLRITPKQTEIDKSEAEAEKTAKIETDRIQLDVSGSQKITSTPIEEAKISKPKIEEKKSSIIKTASRTTIGAQADKTVPKVPTPIETSQPA